MPACALDFQSVQPSPLAAAAPAHPADQAAVNLFLKPAIPPCSYLPGVFFCSLKNETYGIRYQA